MSASIWCAVCQSNIQQGWFSTAELHLAAVARGSHSSDLPPSRVAPCGRCGAIMAVIEELKDSVCPNCGWRPMDPTIDIVDLPDDEVCKWCAEPGCGYAACEVLERKEAELILARKVVAAAICVDKDLHWCRICDTYTAPLNEPVPHMYDCPVAEYNEVMT